MNHVLKHIRVLSDGRPGHENQSLGLAEALARRTGATVEVVRFSPESGLLARLRTACGRAEGIPLPGLVISAGHRTHLALHAAGQRFGARTVVIMKPTLPLWMFDLCLVPRHDLKRPQDTGRVVTTLGALNRIPETQPSKTNSGVVLIGGPSKHHGWSGALLPAMVAEIMRARPDMEWTIGDSRRTPAGFIEVFSGLGAKIVPHQQAQAGWLAAQLAGAREVWVTEDSVSMIFEAITARARVGVLPMPVKNPEGRTVKAIKDIVESGYALSFSQWQSGDRRNAAMPLLHETARCADLVLARFFR